MEDLTVFPTRAALRDAKSIYSVDKKFGLFLDFPNFSLSSIFQFSVFLRSIKTSDTHAFKLTLDMLLLSIDGAPLDSILSRNEEEMEMELVEKKAREARNKIATENEEHTLESHARS